MPTAVESPIDFKQLKRVLGASSEDDPANCAVARFGDGSVSLAVDRRKPAKVLGRGLEGPTPVRCYFGVAYHDAFPGTLCLKLDRAPQSLAHKLKLALRGSGFGKVQLTRAEDSGEDESEEF